MNEGPSTACCHGDFYAGLFANNGRFDTCVEDLSGSTSIPEKSIEYDAIEDESGKIDGIELRYVGAPSKKYVKLNVYCSRTE